MKNILYTIWLLILTLLFNNPLSAQCPPDGTVELFTQSDIIFFIANYPNCSVINGELLIGRHPNNVLDIDDLSGLGFVTEINGTLIIHNNPILTSLNGLQNITSVVNLAVENNAQLTTLEGLQGLASAEFGIKISNSTALTSISHLSRITSTNTIFLSSLSNLSDLTGLHNLTSISSQLSITELGSITDLSSFTNLQNLGGLELSRNSNLTDISGLTASFTFGNIGSALIHDNNNLSNCNATAICNVITSGFVEIECNANGCNSLLEVQVDCGTPQNSVCPVGVHLSSQTDVDAFIANYSHCTTLASGLNIHPFSNNCSSNSTDINDLSGLNFLTEINGPLIIHNNPILTSLNGLQNRLLMPH